MPTSRLVGIDVLRVIAGAALLVAHGAWWLAGWRVADVWWLLLGYLGMEVFLVSCGFLLALPLLRGDAFALPTLRRTLWRWLPPYLLVVLLNWPLAAALGQPHAQWWQSLFLLQNLWRDGGAFFAEGWIIPLLTWSLPLALLLCAALRRLSRGQGLTLLAIVLVISQLPRIAAVLCFDPAWDAGVRKAVLLRLDTLLYGVTAAWCWQMLPPRWNVRLALAGSLGLLLCAWLFMNLPLDTSVLARTGLFPLGAAAIAALLPALARLRADSRPLLSAIASSAFAGLLTHMTLLRLLALAGVPLTTQSRAGGVLALLGYMVAATLLALVVNYGLLRPLRRRA